MKALSIIGIILSIIGVFFTILEGRGIVDGGIVFVLNIFIGLFFLSFSIVGCIVAFKKKI